MVRYAWMRQEQCELRLTFRPTRPGTSCERVHGRGPSRRVSAVVPRLRGPLPDRLNGLTQEQPGPRVMQVLTLLDPGALPFAERIN